MFSAMVDFLNNPLQRQKWTGWGARMLVIVLAFLFAYFPIVWVASASVNETGTLNTQQLVPDNFGFDNYSDLLDSEIKFTDDLRDRLKSCSFSDLGACKDQVSLSVDYYDVLRRQSLRPFGTWMWNSIKVATITSILSVMISAFGAYAFSRFRFSGRRNLMLTIFLVQVFPNSLTIVATFLLVQSIGKQMEWLGLNRHGGLILVYLGGALGINTWLMKGFFDSIPRDLDESAKIDGASDWLIFWRIIFPLVRPILAVVGILTFIGVYGDVIISLTLLKDKEVQTLAIGLNRFISDAFNQEWGVFSAGALIGAIPIVVVILTFQRFLVSGLTEGAVKG
jgi:arabinogalactan oligomer/maltooligosaccharide transport system permease protein